jgi:predicted membrane protein (TIGR00267 family)
MTFAKKLSRIRSLLKMGSSEDIAKRYFVMNAFDGALTALGIIIGAWIAGVSEPRTLILAGLGASIAMGVSGGFGAYLTESAVKKEELAEFQDAMLEEFNDTVFSEAARIESFFVALVDGSSPFLASVVSFSPFFLGYFFEWPMDSAYLLAVLLTACTLFLLGAYLGIISQENLLINGTKMLIAGVLTVILVLFLEVL